MSFHRTISMTWIVQSFITSLLLVCCLMNGIGVRCEDSDEESKITITAKTGKDAEFTCSVRDLGRRKIIWRRLSDPYPISVGATRFAPNRQYKVEKLNSTAYRLTISDVGVKDAGEYECRVSGETLSKVITLNVKAGPLRPFLLPTLTEVKAPENATVLLECEVSNLNNKMVLWKNDRNEVISLRKKIHIGDRRFYVIHQTAPQWSLQVTDITANDYGYYTCIVNSNPVLTRTVHLKRDVAPDMPPKLIRDSNYRVEVSAKEGEDVNMTCNFQAKPRAQVTWYRRIKVNGESKKEDSGEGNTLTLRSVRAEQAGTYFCVGKNGLKPYGRGRTRLDVIAPTVPPTTTTTVLVPTGPVSPHMYHIQPRVQGVLGRTAVLSCTAIGQPRPKIDWHFNGLMLPNNHKYQQTSQWGGRYNTTSELRIITVIPRDFGTYKCDGVNQLGLSTLEIELYR